MDQTPKINWKKKIVPLLNFGAKYRAYLLIAGIAIATYLPTLWFDFSYMDDDNLILNNQPFLNNFANIFTAFGQDIFHNISTAIIYYRPMLMVTLVTDYQFAGATPWIYHLTNLLIHIIVSGLIFKVLKTIKISLALSLFFALWFAVHPVLTQAVAWIPGRNDSLLTLFVLPAFLFYIQFAKNQNSFSGFWHILFFLLALFTKEPALGLIPTCLLFSWLFQKSTILTIAQKTLYWFWLLIIIFWLGARSTVLAGKSSHLDLGLVFKDLLSAFPATLQFLGKIIFPFNLSTFPTLEDTKYWWGILALIVIIIALQKAYQKNNRYLVLGFVWFFAFLAPTFIRVDGNLVTGFVELEHRLYLPFLGIFLIFSQFSFLNRFSWSHKNTAFIATLFLLISAGLTINHSLDYKNRLSFWESAAKGSPNSPATLRNLGTIYYLEGRLEEAEKYYHQTLTIDPKDSVAYNNLGVLFLDQKKLTEAEAQFNKSLEFASYDKALFNLGLIRSEQNKEEEAAEYWEKTILINPEHLEAYWRLAQYYQEKGDINRSEYHQEQLRLRGF